MTEAPNAVVGGIDERLLLVQVDQLRTTVEALAAKVRHHDELLRRANRRSRRSA